MTVRPALIAAGTALALACIGCAPPGGARDSLIMTSGGHVVDSRGWAVGSTAGFTVNYAVPGAGIRFEGDGVVEDAASPYGEPMLYGASSTIEGAIASEGDFDVVVQDGLRVELGRRTLEAREPAGFQMGVVLDDCPEYADVLVGDEPAFLLGSQVTVAPAPVDSEGRQLLGRLPYSQSSDLSSGGDWYGYDATVAEGGYLYLDVSGDGSISVTAGGEELTFPVRAVEPADLDTVEIAAQAEKHGENGQSLLTVLGRTADGLPVAGLEAQWSDGGTSDWIHASNASTVEACFEGLCASWTGSAE